VAANFYFFAGLHHSAPNSECENENSIYCYKEQFSEVTGLLRLACEVYEDDDHQLAEGTLTKVDHVNEQVVVNVVVAFFSLVRTASQQHCECDKYGGIYAEE